MHIRIRYLNQHPSSCIIPTKSGPEKRLLSTKREQIAMPFRLLMILVALLPECVFAQENIDRSNNPQQSISRVKVDCAKVGASIDFIICRDPNLAAWDARMRQAYGLRLASLGRDEDSRRELAETQTLWEFQRDLQCNQMQLATVKSCVIDLTKARVEALQKTDNSATRPLSEIAITSQVWDFCSGNGRSSADLQIGGCTAIISFGQETPENLGLPSATGATVIRPNAIIAAPLSTMAMPSRKIQTMR